MRILELFAGIGGFTIAAENAINAVNVTAIDINTDAAFTYRSNFAHTFWVRELESLPVRQLSDLNADLWWMSPPCTPFTRKGNRKGIDDVRCNALKHIVHAMKSVQPTHVMVENVVGFEESEAISLLHDAWMLGGYNVQILTLCPTQFGIPNRRPRVYCIASKRPLHELPEIQPLPHLLSEYLDLSLRRSDDPDLWLHDSLVDRYLGAINVVVPLDPFAVTACFGAAYGKSITRSGSYLKTSEGVRRFTPVEVANLLGIPESFQFPKAISRLRQWHLLGNSLSITVVEYLLSAISID